MPEIVDTGDEELGDQEGDEVCVENDERVRPILHRSRNQLGNHEPGDTTDPTAEAGVVDTERNDRNPRHCRGDKVPYNKNRY